MQKHVGIAFMVCGSVMALFQGLAVGYLSGRVAEMAQLAFGFSLMGTGIALLLLVRTQPLVYGAIGLLAAAGHTEFSRVKDCYCAVG